MSDISLDGKAAIVTGSAGGLGQAMAVALAEAGAEVLAVDIDGDRIGDTVAAAKDAAPRIHPWAADVSKDDDRAGIIAASAEQCGGVDVLINNAGIGQATIRADYAVNPLKPWEIEAEHLLNFHAVHSVAPLRLAAAALPTMRAQGKGKIVTVTTGLGHHAFQRDDGLWRRQGGQRSLSGGTRTRTGRYRYHRQHVRPRRHVQYANGPRPAWARPRKARAALGHGATGGMARIRSLGRRHGAAF